MGTQIGLREIVIPFQCLWAYKLSKNINL